MLKEQFYSEIQNDVSKSRIDFASSLFAADFAAPLGHGENT